MHQSLEQPLYWAWAGELDFSAIRARLAAIGYTPQNVAADLGLGNTDDLYPLDYRLLPAILDRLEASPDPRAVAVTSLLLGLPVDAAKLRAALTPESVDFLQRAGLVAAESGAIHALLSIVPFEGLLIVADKLFMNADPEVLPEGLSSENAVWRLDRTTRIMSQALPRKQWDRALETCCGSGVLSLLLALQAGQLLGADINPRAVNLAQFNARLNGSANVEFRHSDLFAETGDKRYGLIFMNPPSAPGLVKAWNREGGGSGREVVEAGIAGARPRLTEDGLFLTSLHLGYRADQDILDWTARQFPRDEYRTVIVRHSESWSAEEYALNEALRKCGPRDFEAYHRTYRMYRESLSALGIERIAFAVLAARPSPRPGTQLVTEDLYGGDWPALLAPVA